MRGRNGGGVGGWGRGEEAWREGEVEDVARFCVSSLKFRSAVGEQSRAQCWNAELSKYGR